MTSKQYIPLLIVTATCSFAFKANAQDTIKRKTIDITSTFKPVLKEAVKINFDAAPPAQDTSMPALKYIVPQQQLFLNYQPVALNPVALQIDSVTSWQSSNYIKIGVGNVHIPFIQAGFSFGDSKSKFFNVFAQQYNSKGSLPFQKNNHTSVGLNGTLKTPKNLEWTGKLGFKSEDYFLYGYQPATLVFTKEQLRQRYQTVNGGVSLRNLTETTYGLSYNPSLNVSVFSGNTNKNKATESNTVLNLPLQKSIGKTFGINLGFTADLTNYRPAAKNTVNNNLYYISPSLLFKTPNFYMQTGAIPSWDNKKFRLLPNIMADITTNDKALTIQLGYIGYYNKGSYQRFADINPWIAKPALLLNTRVQEVYGGFKGSFLGHFTYSAKVGFNKFRNMPLFVNDSIDGKTFYTVYSSAIDQLQMHGELGYTMGETFTGKAGFTFNQFSKIRDQQRVWGIVPLEFNAGIRVKVLKDLFVKTDLYAFDGTPYVTTKTREARKGDKGFDLSAGIEFKILKQVNLWLQMNNLLNNKYERWHQYPVYGFNMLGGVVFNFNQQ
jgi:hypothetical protein